MTSEQASITDFLQSQEYVDWYMRTHGGQQPPTADSPPQTTGDAQQAAQDAVQSADAPAPPAVQAVATGQSPDSAPNTVQSDPPASQPSSPNQGQTGPQQLTPEQLAAQQAVIAATGGTPVPSLPAPGQPTGVLPASTPVNAPPTFSPVPGDVAAGAAPGAVVNPQAAVPAQALGPQGTPVAQVQAALSGTPGGMGADAQALLNILQQLGYNPSDLVRAVESEADKLRHAMEATMVKCESCGQVSGLRNVVHDVLGKVVQFCTLCGHTQDMPSVETFRELHSG